MKDIRDYVPSIFTVYSFLVCMLVGGMFLYAGLTIHDPIGAISCFCKGVGSIVIAVGFGHVAVDMIRQMFKEDDDYHFLH